MQKDACFLKKAENGILFSDKNLNFCQIVFLDLAVAKSLQSPRTVTDNAAADDDVQTTTGRTTGYTC